MDDFNATNSISWGDLRSSLSAKPKMMGVTALADGHRLKNMANCGGRSRRSSLSIFNIPTILNFDRPKSVIRTLQDVDATAVRHNPRTCPMSVKNLAVYIRISTDSFVD